MGAAVSWRLGRRPALDGIRGTAVALVVVAHASVPSSPAHFLGAAGVTSFFTLSGFLITALLLAEHDRTGSIDLRAFVVRRARRLMPALLVLLAVVGLLGLLIPRFVHPVVYLGALTYTGNWVAVATGGVYDPLGHTWSLAVEEQFYLVWPLVFLAVNCLPARWQPRALIAAVVGTALLPLAFKGAGMWLHTYYGSDTRAMPLLVGCLLAWLIHRSRPAPSLPSVAALSLALPPLLAATMSTPARTYLLPQVVAVLTATAIWAATRGPGLGWLEWPPLVLLGRRSYGLYLWHFPALYTAGLWLGPLATAMVAIPAALALTAASWRFVEQPALAGARTSQHRTVGAAGWRGEHRGAPRPGAPLDRRGSVGDEAGGPDGGGGGGADTGQ
ncbi:MAG TPA: acyltransferase [Nocardioides sp.]|uniref:acyltransferase family protein n=1 Tax=Nocardioides sp. TaxID=35761 RepID=UPI002E378835|nr:acyltransferase [Nocardioides sp.]HEX5090525.1 acyltransferase [Nocardioides sp.]